MAQIRCIAGKINGLAIQEPHWCSTKIMVDHGHGRKQFFIKDSVGGNFKYIMICLAKMLKQLAASFISEHQKLISIHRINKLVIHQVSGKSDDRCRIQILIAASI